MSRSLPFKKYSFEDNMHVWRGEFSYTSEKDYQKARIIINKTLAFITEESNIWSSVRIPDIKKGIVILKCDDAANAYFTFLYGNNNFCLTLDEEI